MADNQAAPMSTPGTASSLASSLASALAASSKAEAKAKTVTKHGNTKVGHVVSHSGNKTIVVEVTRRVQHPLYKRYINKTKKFYAHDEQNQCRVGDSVRIVESRRLSSLKRWRLVEIVHRSAAVAKDVQAAEAAASAKPAAPGASKEAGS